MGHAIRRKEMLRHEHKEHILSSLSTGWYYSSKVSTNPYLGTTSSEDLQWSTYIQNIIIKSNSTLVFLQRNLKNCPEECRKLACISLVRSTLEYGSSVSDPSLQKDINCIEKSQRQAARFIKKDYRSREDGCVTTMLRDLELPSLQQWREFNKRLDLLCTHTDTDTLHNLTDSHLHVSFHIHTRPYQPPTHIYPYL